MQTPSKEMEGSFFMRAVIFANGVLEKPERTVGLLRPDDYLIAADGGLGHIRRLGLVPNLVIGDLDSINPQDETWLAVHKIEVRQFLRDKDFTDLELAVQAAREGGFTQILIAAALGGRLDQALANIALLWLPALRGLDIALDDGVTSVRLLENRLEIAGNPGDLVSLLPWGGPAAGVVTHTLKYPLKAETLTPGQTRGISNVMLGRSAVVEIAAGTLLCVHIHQDMD